MIPHNLIKELAEYKEDVYRCPECGFFTMLDRGKHFQCQNTTGENGSYCCGIDWEYAGDRFNDPDAFEQWRKNTIKELQIL